MVSWLVDRAEGITYIGKSEKDNVQRPTDQHDLEGAETEVPNKDQPL